MGAAGLRLGLLGFRLIRVAAAAGLVLLSVGAIVAHLRAEVLGEVAVVTNELEGARMERVAGIEPASTAWKATRLPN